MPAAPRDIYVHCAISVPYLAALNASIPGVERYAERALLLAERDDVVCLTDAIDPDYMEYLAELGIGPAPENLVIASRFDRGVSARPLWQRLLESSGALECIEALLSGRSAGQVQPFIASRGQFQLAAALEKRTGIPVGVIGGPANVVGHADQKHHVRAKALELGVPVAEGEVVDLTLVDRRSRVERELLLMAIERHIGSTGRVIVRGTSGAAGSSTFVASRGDIPELLRRLVSCPENRIYLVESMVEATASPNVQMRVDPAAGLVECMGVTDQRWEQGLIHGGNLYPSAARCIGDMVGWAETLSRWLMGEGFAGIAGFDFVEYGGADGKPRAFLAEINPRINGATYPLHLIRRLGTIRRQDGRVEVGAFASGTIKTEARTFGQLREQLGDLLWLPDGEAGLVPYVTGGLPYGKCGVVALATTAVEAAELLAEADSAMDRACAIG
jgi:Pre ATP-grasp domain